MFKTYRTIKEGFSRPQCWYNPAPSEKMPWKLCLKMPPYSKICHHWDILSQVNQKYLRVKRKEKKSMLTHKHYFNLGTYLLTDLQVHPKGKEVQTTASNSY